MASNKEIRRRIKSVRSTGKITKAMEMVAASKMRRAVSAVLNIRPYAHSAWSVLTNLSRAFEQYESGLLEIRGVKKILMIIISSNRGLCGSFNTQTFRKVRQELENTEKLMINRIGRKKIESKISLKELAIDFITIGKKSENFVRRLGREIIATFPNLAYFSPISEVRPLAKIVLDSYNEKKYDKVVVVYTDYISPVNQQTKIRQLLPVSVVDLEKQIAEMDVLIKEYGLDEPVMEYKVEPDPKEVLEYIFPRLAEMQIYHAILESAASQESARMMAMRNATDAAQEMADVLQLTYNQIRQMKITQEISEISAGRVALEN